MDDEECERRRRYIEETRAMLDRLAEEDAARAASAEAEPESRYSPEPRLTQSFGNIPLRSSEPPDRWRRGQEELAVTRNREKTMTDAECAKQWAEWADRRIAAALGERARATTDAIGEAAQIHAQLRC